MRVVVEVPDEVMLRVVTLSESNLSPSEYLQALLSDELKRQLSQAKSSEIKLTELTDTMCAATLAALDRAMEDAGPYALWYVYSKAQSPTDNWQVLLSLANQLATACGAKPGRYTAERCER